jgi:hypothetical protein
MSQPTETGKAGVGVGVGVAVAEGVSVGVGDGVRVGVGVGATVGGVQLVNANKATHNRISQRATET